MAYYYMPKVCFILHTIFCLPQVIQRKQGLQGCWTLFLRSVVSTGVHLDRVALYMTLRFPNQCKASLMHVFWEETSVNWKSTQTQGKRLTYALNILSACQTAIYSNIKTGEIDHTSRYYCRCKNVNISTCRPLACRTWLRHCLTVPVANDTLSWLPASEEAPVSRDFCGIFQQPGKHKRRWTLFKVGLCVHSAFLPLFC